MVTHESLQGGLLEPMRTEAGAAVRVLKQGVSVRGAFERQS